MSTKKQQREFVDFAWMGTLALRISDVRAIFPTAEYGSELRVLFRDGSFLDFYPGKCDREVALNYVYDFAKDAKAGEGK